MDLFVTPGLHGAHHLLAQSFIHCSPTFAFIIAQHHLLSKIVKNTKTISNQSQIALSSWCKKTQMFKIARISRTELAATLQPVTKGKPSRARSWNSFQIDNVILFACFLIPPPATLIRHHTPNLNIKKASWGPASEAKCDHFLKKVSRGPPWVTEMTTFSRTSVSDHFLKRVTSHKK